MAKDPAFAADHHDYIKSKYYDVQNGALKADGIDLSGRGKAVQDALWSTSVQFRGLTPDIFENGLKEKFGKDYKLSNLSDKDIIEAVQEYKVNHNNTLFKKSPTLWPGLLKRAENEKSDLLQLAKYEEIVAKHDKKQAGVAQESIIQLADSRNPDHALYAAIRERLPAELSDDVAANILLHAKQNGITSAEKLNTVAISNGQAFVMGKTEGDWAKVDLAVAPPIEKINEQLAGLSAQQAQREAQQISLGR